MASMLTFAVCGSAALIGCWSGASGGLQPRVGASYVRDGAPDGAAGHRWVLR